MNMTQSLKITTGNEREIIMTREFNAPRQLVFDAWTKPELLRRWFGKFNGWALTVCEVDLRVGGSWRFVMRRPDGQEMGMSGVYREIVSPERIVSSERFDEAWYSGEAYNILSFVEQKGVTTLTTTAVYDSQQTRDAVLKSGMEKGVAAGYDEMAQVLAELLTPTHAKEQV